MLAGLPPGEYELRAEIPGFKPHVRRGLALAVADAVVVNIVLEVGGTEALVVVEATPVVNTTSSELSYLVGADTIEQPAAQRPQLHRPGVAAAGRARLPPP